MRIKWIWGFLFSEFPGFVSHSVWAHLSPAEVSVLIFPSIDSCWINEIKACGGSFFPSLEKLDWSENGLGGDGNFCWSPNYCAWLISVSHHQQNSHRQSDLRQSNTEIAFFCLTLQLSPWVFFLILVKHSPFSVEIQGWEPGLAQESAGGAELCKPFLRVSTAPLPINNPKRNLIHHQPLAQNSGSSQQHSTEAPILAIFNFFFIYLIQWKVGLDGFWRGFPSRDESQDLQP